MAAAGALLALLVLLRLGLPSLALAGFHDDHKLLVILVDGLRWDYHLAMFPGFRHFSLNGVRAEYVEPTFPASTLPNLYTIMTGLYPESHGMTADYMYNIDKNLSFSKMADLHLDSDPTWWNGGDPLWVAATRQKKRAFMFRWPGCEVFIRDTKPVFCKPIADWRISHEDFQHSVEEAVRLFTNESADFIAIYHTDPGDTSRKWGTKSQRVKNVIMDIDDVIARLQKRLETTSLASDAQTRLSDVVNLMFLSNHGVTTISPSHVINMTSALTSPLIRHIVTEGSFVQIWPEPGQTENVMQLLTRHRGGNYQAYRKSDMPSSWRYEGGPFVAPVVLLAEPSYTFLTPTSPSFPTFKRRPLAGNHGYNSSFPDMRGVLWARGPHFRRNLTVAPLCAVHLYQLMCTTLGVDMSSNEGTWSAVSSMLRPGDPPPQPYRRTGRRDAAATALVVVALLFCVLSAGCALYCHRHKLRHWLQRRGTQWQPLHDGVL